MIKQLPNKEYLQSIFEYHDGQLFRKVDCKSFKKGMKVGWVGKNGYFCTDVNGVRYRLHRLIYQFHYGNCPEFLDHIDCNKSNNKIENLRPATSKQNSANRKITKTNKLGLKGVCFDKKKYKASIKINGKSIHIGTFNDPNIAHFAYCKKAKELFGEFSCTNNNKLSI